jgi:hypothetical protein
MATQESLLKPLVAQILTTAKKATAFGGPGMLRDNYRYLAR